MATISAVRDSVRQPVRSAANPADSTLGVGLIARWRMDEASAGDRSDSVGSFTLTQAGTVGSSSTSVSGNSADFDGTNTNFLHNNSTTLRHPDDFTAAGWFRPGSTAGNPALVSCAGSGGGYGYWLGINASSQFRMFGSADGSALTEAIFTAVTVSLNTWYHVAFWHDSTAEEIGISVDGGTPVTTAHTGGLFDPTTRFVLGGRDGGASTLSTYTGQIDELRFYTRALTTSEISQLANQYQP